PAAGLAVDPLRDGELAARTLHVALEVVGLGGVLERVDETPASVAHERGIRSVRLADLQGDLERLGHLAREPGELAELVRLLSEDVPVVLDTPVRAPPARR